MCIGELSLITENCDYCDYHFSKGIISIPILRMGFKWESNLPQTIIFYNCAMRVCGKIDAASKWWYTNADDEMWHEPVWSKEFRQYCRVKIHFHTSLLLSLGRNPRSLDITHAAITVKLKLLFDLIKLQMVIANEQRKLVVLLEQAWLRLLSLWSVSQITKSCPSLVYLLLFQIPH